MRHSLLQRFSFLTLFLWMQHVLISATWATDPPKEVLDWEADNLYLTVFKKDERDEDDYKLRTDIRSLITAHPEIAETELDNIEFVRTIIDSISLRALLNDILVARSLSGINLGNARSQLKWLKAHRQSLHQKRKSRGTPESEHTNHFVEVIRQLEPASSELDNLIARFLEVRKTRETPGTTASIVEGVHRHVTTLTKVTFVVCAVAIICFGVFGRGGCSITPNADKVPEVLQQKTHEWKEPGQIAPLAPEAIDPQEMNLIREDALKGKK